MFIGITVSIFLNVYFRNVFIYELYCSDLFYTLYNLMCKSLTKQSAKYMVSNWKETLLCSEFEIILICNK